MTIDLDAFEKDIKTYLIPKNKYSHLQCELRRDILLYLIDVDQPRPGVYLENTCNNVKEQLEENKSKPYDLADIPQKSICAVIGKAARLPFIGGYPKKGYYFKTENGYTESDRAEIREFVENFTCHEKTY